MRRTFSIVGKPSVPCRDTIQYCGVQNIEEILSVGFREFHQHCGGYHPVLLGIFILWRDTISTLDGYYPVLLRKIPCKYQYFLD